jgi:uncharacterized protein (TIRG00374 family)
LLAVLLYFLDYGQISDGFSRIQSESIFLAVAIAALLLLAASVRWWTFVRAARFPHGFWVSIRVRLIAQFINLILPSGVVGDGLQVFLVSRRPRLSGPLALATILVDRLIALVAVVLILIMTAQVLGEDKADLVYMTILASGVFIAIFICGVFLVQNMKKTYFSIGRLSLIRRFILETTRAISSFKNAYFTLFLAFTLAVVGVLGNAAVAWVLLSGLAEVQFWQLIPTLCLVMLAAFIPATFSGMGVREWILYANLKDYGLSLEESVALSLTLFVVVTLTAGILSLLSGSYSVYRGESTSWIQAVFHKSR